MARKDIRRRNQRYVAFYLELKKNTLISHLEQEEI